MNDPIKIVWKYKNNNRRVQYASYIFIGDKVPKDIIKILENIKELTFYDTLVRLTKTDYKKLESFYGEKWYEKFFNIYHIDSSIDIIKDSSIQKREIEDKYGSDWYQKNINQRKIVKKDIIYSYEAQVKYENEHKHIKERGFSFTDDEVDIDYKTIKDRVVINSETSTISMSSLSDDFNEEQDEQQEGGKKRKIEEEINYRYGFDPQEGGQDVDDDINYSEDLPDESEIDDLYNQDETEDNVFILERADDEDIVREDDSEELMEIEDLYREDDVEQDKRVSETSNLIKKALDDNRIFERQISKMVDFDTSFDNSEYDNNLKDVFKKIYVTNQYIFRDDSIKIIKNKVTCGLKMNPKFGDELYLLPSRQYFWIEYDFEDKINKISLGQKWMKRNELLNIDIEPNNNMKVYEELRGNLKNLRDDMKRYNNKIRPEDEDSNILFDYSTYMVTNEIYMIDVYNELGLGFNPDPISLKNVQDTYLRLYFRKIKSEDIRNIIDLLNGNNNIELQKSGVIFETINNDQTLENEIVSTVEDVRINEEFEYIFKENYITQSAIHVNVRYTGAKRLDLYKIFNNFVLNDTYPFMQYRTMEGSIVYIFKEEDMVEYYSKKSKSDILSKWFQNVPYGISFKTRIRDKTGDKFLSINLHENGKIEYKIQWKEQDMATVEDIKKTYVYIYNLIDKINKENKNKFVLEPPREVDFKYAFINTIQKFELPNKYLINHNDLSNFARYFFPYVALIVDPKKRQSKIQQRDTEKSKYGTYLRYKKVSKYENQARIEQRIMYFIRNFEFTEKDLVDELSKQFNITEQKALEEYDRVRSKYPNLKKSRKVLKKLENIPKFKSPGIGIDIQGKDPMNYKIRISGAKSKEQLNRIISFMNILIFLYVDIYLRKNPNRQAVKKKLEQLKNIAKRRNKVEDHVNHSKDVSQIKQMAKIDKQRIGFKPEKGKDHYSRLCQNSGEGKKRRPQLYESMDIDHMLTRGYFLNKKTGTFERRVVVKENGKKKEVTLSAIKLPGYDENGDLTGNDVFYTCDPELNGEHFYVGFLTKSKNPFGQCMPCCFKKDQLSTTSKKKKEIIENCLNPSPSKKTTGTATDTGDKLYILQDTNKLEDKRIAFLPRQLDFYFNELLNKKIERKHHYLSQTDGYFFKYGSDQSTEPFLNCIGSLLDTTPSEIKDKVIKFLTEKDKSSQYFTAMNNGETKTQFRTLDNFITFIKNSESLDYNLMGDIISMPGILTKHGLNIVVFRRDTTIVNFSFEKQKTKENFYIHCQNMENTDGLKDKYKECILILKEDEIYNPIVMAIKEEENDKSLDIVKKFHYDEDNDNIVYHINDFYQKSCLEYFIEKRQTGITAKLTRKVLDSLKNVDYQIRYQYIDAKNKCKYLITKNEVLVPVYQSGSLYDIQIIKNITRYIKDYNTTLKQLDTLYTASKGKIPLKQIGVYINSSKSNDSENVIVNGIMTDAYLVPTTDHQMSRKELSTKGLLIESNPETEDIDISIEEGQSGIIQDKRVSVINRWKYDTESYELFRLEFSDFINDPENSSLKTKLTAIINNTGLSKLDKREKVKLFLYKLIDDELYQKYKSIVQQTGGKKFVHLSEKVPDLSNYQIENEKTVCSIHPNKEVCNIHPHCRWTHSSCTFISTTDNLIKMVNKIAEELVRNDIGAFEILRVGNYFVSDIGDYEKFTERKGQRIVKSTSLNINTVLDDVFGKDRIFYKTEKNRLKAIEESYQELNQSNPIIDMKTFLLQRILPNNISIFRAYSNSYYWAKNKFSDTQSRNLGFYHPIQTDLAIFFKSSVITWLQKRSNIKTIPSNILDYLNSKKSIDESIEAFIIKLVKGRTDNTNGIFELYVINQFNDIPIVVYDEYQAVIYIFDNGLIFDGNVTNQLPKNLEKYVGVEDYINLRFVFGSDDVMVPERIDAKYFTNV
jgi:hypothetical protein